jgi:glycosyltransferase involved in cell wall biosynthesis
VVPVPGGPPVRVLVITQYFPPETGGPSNRLSSIAQGLKDAGHDVTVIAEKPNHPDGVVWPEYRRGLLQTRDYNGIPVVYSSVWTCPTKTFWTRTLFYLSFMAMAVAGSLRARGAHDVVLASSPPLFVGVAGWVVSRLKRSRFVFDVRDLWPDVAVAVGVLGPGRMLRIAKRLEAFIYRSADGITAVTRGFCEEIARMAPAGTPIARIGNGTVPAVFGDWKAGKELRERLGLTDRYVVTYAGNLGIAQGLPHVLEAADILQRQRAPVTLLFVGAGPAAGVLHRQAAARSLANVRFEPGVPLEEAARYMAASDALLVPLARHDIYRMFIPSKLFDGMAAGKPVLLSVDGEAREILEEAGAGLYYAAEDAGGLIDGIRWLMAHPEEAAEMGRRGAEYVGRRFSREAEAAKMARFLVEVAGAPGRKPDRRRGTSQRA